MSPTAASIRQAIEVRLNQRARAEGVDANRLRRALVFERLLVRLETAEAGAWVVKGGMALEWRLGARARATRDLDLVLRGDALSGAELRDKLIDLLTEDPQGDHFRFEIGPATALDVGTRFSVRATLAGREFASVRVDVASRGEELLVTERIYLPPTVPAYGLLAQPRVELAAASQHFAEKLHAFTRDYGEHPNTRLRDLVDLMILIERELVQPHEVVPAVRHVFASRSSHEVPRELSDPPASWDQSYAALAARTELRATTLAEAMVTVRRFWAIALSEAESA